VTTALPNSCSSVPSPLLRARLAVATVSRPLSLMERMRGWSISSVSLSGKCRASVPITSLLRRPLPSKVLTEKPRMK
jgi:hypothetical protein